MPPLDPAVRAVLGDPPSRSVVHPHSASVTTSSLSPAEPSCAYSHSTRRPTHPRPYSPAQLPLPSTAPPLSLPSANSRNPCSPRNPLNPPNSPVIVWFRGHDLRVHDHAALDAAVASDAPIVALYVFERGAETDGLDTVKYTRVPEPSPRRSLASGDSYALGRVQLWWLHHSLSVLRQELALLGITLVLRRANATDHAAAAVVGLARSISASAVYWNSRYKPRAYPLDNAVCSRLSHIAVHARHFASETLIEPNRPLHRRYDDFQSYTRFWIHCLRDNPPLRPRAPLDPAHVRALDRPLLERMLLANITNVMKDGDTNALPYFGNPLPTVDDLNLLQGLCLEGGESPGDPSAVGCLAAHKTLAAFLDDRQFTRFSSGLARRDGMVTGKDLATSRLSPHVRFGEISPRVLFYAIVDKGSKAGLKGNTAGLEAARTFLKNMSLREFGYYMLGRYPKAASKPIMPEFDAFPWVSDDDGALLYAWKTGTTGFPIVDAAMRQLIREGWIHNRMRFLAASFFCKYLLLPWPLGAAHMVRTLVDGDEACNSLGWQWTAGCNSDSFPFSTLVNPLCLQNHSQSTKRAAAYVRKYVPELARLPDNLIFTPWKVPAEDGQAYNLTLVSQEEYRHNSGRWSPSRILPGAVHGMYPIRVVNGPDARVRARNAMEVMRRIFAAQRQCRTIIVDQTIPVEGGTVLEAMEKRFKRVVDLDQESLDSMSLVTGGRCAVIEIPKHIRIRDGRVGAELQAPAKRQRLSTESLGTRTMENCGSQAETMSVAYLSNSEISRGEIDLLLSSSIPSNHDVHRNPRTGNYPEMPVASTVARSTRIGAESAAKRPRSSLPQGGLLTDERLSVQALLISSQPSSNIDRNRAAPLKHPGWGDSGGSKQFTRASKQSAFPPLPNSSPAPPDVPGSMFRDMERSHGPHACNLQSPMASSVSKEKLLINAGRIGPAVHHGPNSPSLVHPPRKETYQDAHAEQLARTPPHGLAGVPPVSLLQHGPIGQPAKGEVIRSGDFGCRPAVMTGSQLPIASTQHASQKRATVQTPLHYEANRAVNNGFYHSSVQPVSLMQEHYQVQQPRNSQMLLPFRNESTARMAPQVAPMHSADASQRYFAMPPINAHSHGAPGQQYVWYPATIPQYVDVRMHAAMPGSHMLNQLVSHHNGHLPVGYGQPGINAQDLGGGRSMIPLPNGGQATAVDPNADTKRGPSSPLEREAIARRMAAMDYYDDSYGGKHWEQWQAIALHLLDQYEFSADTDRETSKSYVRLCVLKDELRDANPQGPRVTVNHCKEVFRILRLPVTGEWDRRGHGGVRGPYCYGCVKRSGVHISKKT